VRAAAPTRPSSWLTRGWLARRGGEAHEKEKEKEKQDGGGDGGDVGLTRGPGIEPDGPDIEPAAPDIEG